MVSLRRRIERTEWPGERTRGHREPRNESQFVLLAILQSAVVAAIANVVLILHADDRNGLLGPLDIIGHYLRETYVANLALLLQFLDRAKRLFDRNLGINAMKLPQVDALYLESPQAHLHALPQIFRSPPRGPSIRTRSGKPGSGRNHQFNGGRVECLG